MELAHRFRRLGFDDELVLLEILLVLSANMLAAQTWASFAAYLESDLHRGDGGVVGGL